MFQEGFLSKGVFSTKHFTRLLLISLAITLTGCGSSGSSSRQINITPPQNTQTIQEYVNSQQFSGSIYIADENNILLDAGFGNANRATNQENSAETVFRIGSITKQFTAAAILLLVEEGLVALDDPVQHYIKDFPNGDIITVHHLLTHTSGLPNYTALPNIGDIVMVPHTPEQLLATFVDLSLEFSPGSEFNYSNSGYAVLGVIIENVSGMSYENFINRRIFEPLAMSDSGYGHNEPQNNNQAQGYQVDGDHATNIDMSVPYAAGALISNTHDLAKWHEALSENTLLNEASNTLMYTPYLNHYALGWQVTTIRNGEQLYSHTGAISGFSSLIMRFPESGRLIVILANVESYPVENFALELANFLMAH